VKLFLDTAHIDQIREVCRWGILDGVTTNPTHVAKTGRAPDELYPELCAAVDGPVSLECVASDADELVAEARQLASIAPNVVVKIPITREGLIAVGRLAEEGIKTNVTVVFSAMQAMLAAKLGATYVSPFVGRLDLIGQKGMEVVRQIKTIYDLYQFPTQIIVAAARNPMHVLEAALAGAHICTIPLEIMEQLYHHPMTDEGIAMFMKDWANVPQTAATA